jgi:glycerol-3-phosphate dehydrogenase
VGALAGLDIPLTPAPGALLAAKGRICDHVVSRLRPATDGDIMVPQRGLSIIGSTQREDPVSDAIRALPEEIAFLRRAGSELFPSFSRLPEHAAWAAARPLSGHSASGGRSLSRDFTVIDHSARGESAGICSLSGGKATVLRAMAEKAADTVCSALGLDSPCRSAEYLLPSWREFHAGESR